jgi:ketosteroid isomerase-like protein
MQLQVTRTPGRVKHLGLACAALLMGQAAAGAPAQAPAATLTMLLDRAHIEDILVDYYANLGGADRGFGSYYTEDGVLDVNGMIARGKAAIEDLYKRTAQGTPRLPGSFHMLLTNEKIVVHGDSATADCIWTGVRSQTPKATPRFVEQGREHDELVKRGGRWYFRHRVITSDGGLPAMFEKSYQQR